MDLMSEAVLSIEAGVLGGSIVVRANGHIFTYSGDAASTAKAELLLPKIDELFRTAEISPNDIKQIVVSAGPGSFTGIRIGIATALGLANALDAPVKRIPLLPAMALMREGIVCASVPVGRGTIASQVFNVVSDSIREVGPPFLHSDTENPSACSDACEIEHFVVTESAETHSGQPSTIVANLAERLLIVSGDPRISDAEPIFLSKPTYARTS